MEVGVAVSAVAGSFGLRYVDIVVVVMVTMMIEST